MDGASDEFDLDTVLGLRLTRVARELAMHCAIALVQHPEQSVPL
jgi:hypothetical protein